MPRVWTTTRSEAKGYESEPARKPPKGVEQAVGSFGSVNVEHLPYGGGRVLDVGSRLAPGAAPAPFSPLPTTRPARGEVQGYTWRLPFRVSDRTRNVRRRHDGR